MALDDALWDLLDKVRLGEFFDKHNIPPIVFPIMIAAVIGLVLFLLLVPLGGEPETCGDGICQAHEDEESCPEDCTPSDVDPPQTSTTIKVYVGGGTKCQTIRVVLKDESGAIIGSPQESSNRAITFQSVTAARVKAEVSSPESNSAAVSSTTINTDSTDTIRVTLAENYCEDQQPQVGTGSIRVTIKDVSTNQNMGANVAVFDSDDTLVRGSDRYISGDGTITNIPANEYYYLTATATGYNEYYGKGENVFVSAGQTASKSISLTPTAADIPKGKLEICVTGDNDPVEHSGEIGIYGVDGDLVKVGQLSDCPLFRGEATSEGCFIFTLDAGRQYYAAIKSAPSGCARSEPIGPFLVEPNAKQTHSINIDCNLIGTVRAIVYADGEVVTANTTVELYKRNGSKFATLNISENGNHTEFIQIPSRQKFYFRVKNVPEGYLISRSSDFEVKADENKTVRIDLEVPKPPLEVIGVSARPNVLHQGQNFTVSASQVKLEGQVLTEGVTVQCRNSWSSSAITAVRQDGKWTCNMTVPENLALGKRTVSVRAQKSGAEPHEAAVDVWVVNETEMGGNITITRNIQQTQICTAQSRVRLVFNINMTNGTVIDPGDPLDQLHESSLNVSFAGGVVVSTRLSKVSDGVFRAEFFVPFDNKEYTYELFVKTIVGDTLYTGFFQYGFYAPTGCRSAGSLTCGINTSIVAPGDPFDVTAHFTLNGEPLAGQSVVVKVAGKNRHGQIMTDSRPLEWDGESGNYKQTMNALEDDSGECIYEVTCYSTVDSSINTSPRQGGDISVVDWSGSAVDPGSCPSNAYVCGSGTDAENLEMARACYKIYRGEYGGLSSQYNHAVACAERALSECSSTASPSGCHQALKFKVMAKKGNDENTTSYMYFWVEGSTEGKTTALSYTKPTIEADDPVYSLRQVYLPGMYVGTPSTSTITGENVILRINSTTGIITAQAVCRINCAGSVGDLDGDGTAHASRDREILQALVGTSSVHGSYSLLGIPTYSPWPPACADTDGDGKLTRYDYACMTNPSLCAGGCSSALSNYRYPTEICNDGYDNNCDGQTDTAIRVQNLIAGTQLNVKDLCTCTAETPCDMLWAVGGGTKPPTQFTESDIYRCVKLSYLNPNIYRWYGPDQWRCNAERASASATLMCNGKTYVCRQIEGNYQWADYINLHERFPPETLQFQGGSGINPHNCDITYGLYGSWRFVCSHDQKCQLYLNGALNNQYPNRWICFDGVAHGCGWQEQDTQNLKKAANNAIIGSWRCEDKIVPKNDAWVPA
jgi:hypothetical protein